MTARTKQKPSAWRGKTATALAFGARRLAGAAKSPGRAARPKSQGRGGAAGEGL